VPFRGFVCRPVGVDTPRLLGWLRQLGDPTLKESFQKMFQPSCRVERSAIRQLGQATKQLKFMFDVQRVRFSIRILSAFYPRYIRFFLLPHL